jgi:hypothetical protein
MSLITLTRSLRLNERRAAARNVIKDEEPSDRRKEFQTALDHYISEYKKHQADAAEKSKSGYSRSVFIQWLWR